MKPRWIFAIGALVLFIGAMPSHAQWSTDPTVNNAICTATNGQYLPKIVSDGVGGAIITWFDSRNSDYDIYAQRINASGVVQWTVDGVAICTAIGNQQAPTIVSDGAGGAIITWHDYRSGHWDVYAQRINASGVVQWTADGVAICTATNEQSGPTIVSDGANGAIITWYDKRTGSSDIYAQRINPSGVVQWTFDGVAICTAANDQWPPVIVSDGADGAIITWYDSRSGNYDIYAQRINASGAVQWTVDGVAICTAIGNQQVPTIVSDGANGAIITWYDNRSANYHIYAQRINASGVVQWSTDGVAICAATNSQIAPAIVSDGAGGAIITWEDYRNGSYIDIYAQRINASGVVQWISDGLAICTAMNMQVNPTIVSDGAGGGIITWRDYRDNFYSGDIYAQRIDASGVVQWTADGVAICTETNRQWHGTIVGDGAGGAIITWWDERSGNFYTADIYAQRVRSDGTLGDNSTPLAKAGADQTVIVNTTVQLNGSGSSDPDGNSLTYAWTITSKPTGSSTALSNPSIVNPTFVADVAGEYRVSLVVNDGTVNSTLDNVIITAITAQDAVHNLIDQVLALNMPQGNGLINGKLQVAIDRLNANDIAGAIAKLREFIDQVNVFISNGKLTVAEGQPLIDAANAIIAALNNPAPAARFKKDGATANELPTGFQLAQNSPNPFNPATTIQFSVPRESHVRLKVYNAFGAEVATLVDRQVAAGTYKVNWDASRLASGFYLYRLEAEGFAQTKKLLLTK